MNRESIQCEPRKRRALLERGPKFRGDFLRLWGRRSRDVILSAVALLVLWPFFLLVALAIVVDDPGAGPIFAQTRVGKDGKCFTMYKFRTMIPNAEAELEPLLPRNERDGPAFKLHDDPRITRVGRFLRRSSIDELPQLWNVLRGDMSLVGPRPQLPREVEHYEDIYRQRLTVMPGITCYWQIRPDRNEMPFSQWMALDLRYIRERGFWTDLKILLATLGAVVSMKGV